MTRGTMSTAPTVYAHRHLGGQHLITSAGRFQR